MEWGFPGYPDKNKPESKPRPLINTKAETASILRTWAKPLREGRCVVPTNGFYEWQHGEGKRKQRYLFRLPGERALFLAGIHNGSGCFSILTAAANESMIPIHNRMPVILRRGELSAWTGEDYLTICDRTPPDLERLPA
jgi:putative SOS response-associated peptidase YedK